MSDLRTYPKRATDPLGRYYTSQCASEALISHLRASTPSKIVDLGSGDGALSAAARNAWSRAEIITVDIDRSPSHRLHASQGTKPVRHHHFAYDALRVDLPELLGCSVSRPDIAICNPPFIKPKWQKGFAAVMEDANLSGAYGCLRDTTADILFLAQNLRLLRKHGKVGIIVPDGIITGKKHSGLRRELATSHTIESVTRLPRTAFNGTDAQAFILTITKGKPTVDMILLNEIDLDGALSTPVFVAAEEAQARLDYGYYALRQKQKPSISTLGELSIAILRGRVSSSKRIQGSSRYFHTTDFPVDAARLSFAIPKQFRVDGNELDDCTARTGDILLARVGRNLEEKVCLVSSGTAPITDCVYIIRPRAENRNKIINSLMSGVGRRWLQELAHGVGARQLPKTDLIKLPI